MIPLEVIHIGSKYYVCEERIHGHQRKLKIPYAVEFVDDPTTKSGKRLQKAYPKDVQWEAFEMKVFDNEEDAIRFIEKRQKTT